MKSSARIFSLLALVGVAIFAFNPSLVSGWGRVKDPPQPKDKKVGLKILVTDALHAFDGEINSTVIVGSRKKKQPGDLKDNYSELKTFSIRATTAGNWNDHSAQQEAVIRQYLKNMGFTTVSLKLAAAVANPKVNSKERPIHLNVDPAKQALTVKYSVPGNTLAAQAGGEEMAGTFDLELVMHFETKGSADFPLQLKSTKVQVRNFVHPTLDKSLANKGNMFSKASFADSGTAKATTTNVNGLLGEYTSQVGGVVTPGERVSNSTPHLVFELSKAPPVLSPK